MNNRYFYYIVETAKCGSFYRAAKNLGISQQGLRKAVESMESELGVTLFERSKNGVILTREGEVVVRHTKNFVAGYNLMVDDLVKLKESSSHENNALSVYVSFYAAQLSAAKSSYIEYLALNTRYIEEPYDRLLKHAECSDGSNLVFLDVHAHSRKLIEENPDIVFDPVINTKLGCVWSDESGFGLESAIPRAVLTEYPVAICAHKEVGQFMDYVFRDHPLQNIRFTSSSPMTLLECARASSETVSIFDAFAFFMGKKCHPDLTSNLHFTPLATPDAECQVGFVYSKSARLSLQAERGIRMAKQFLEDQFGEYLAEYSNPQNESGYMWNSSVGGGINRTS